MTLNLKNQPDLCILITNYNTADFVEVSLMAIHQLTSRKFKVLINDNGSTADHLKKLKTLEQRYDFIKVFYNKSRQKGAPAHAEALDFLIDKADRRYTVILDSDCTPLLKGWDEYLIAQLNEQVKIIGSPVLCKGAAARPTDFPSPFLILFETAILKALHVPSTPGDLSKGEDTCWQWRPAYLKANLLGAVCHAENTRFFKESVFKNVLCAEYYTQDGRLLASHFSRGSTSGEAKYASLFFKIPIVGKRLRRRKGEQEKQIWLKQCLSIIKSQATQPLPAHNRRPLESHASLK